MGRRQRRGQRKNTGWWVEVSKVDEVEKSRWRGWKSLGSRCEERAGGGGWKEVEEEGEVKVDGRGRWKGWRRWSILYGARE